MGEQIKFLNLPPFTVKEDEACPLCGMVAKAGKIRPLAGGVYVHLCPGKPTEKPPEGG